jgi:hypothetical protein
MLRSLSVPAALVLFACGTDDRVPPLVVSITPADGAMDRWLHDPIRIAFSEPVDPASVQGVALLGPAGEAVPVAVVASSDTELTVQVADDAALVGELRLVLGPNITDLAGNPLAETGAAWSVAPWSRSEAPGTAPSLAVDDSGRIVLARTVDEAGARRVAVSQWTGAAWIDLGAPLGARDAVLPSIALDGRGAPVVVWSEFGAAGAATIEAARWIGTAWQPLASPGEGSFAVVASPPGGEPLIAYTVPAPGGGTLVRVRVLDRDGWAVLAGHGFDVPATGAVIGAPQVAAVAPAAPILAFADAGAAAIPPQVRILRWTGAWSEVSPIALGPLPARQQVRVSIAARGGDVVVGYDTIAGSFGVHAVKVVGQTWQRLGGELDVDPAGDAQASAVAIDEDGAPLIAWRELIDGNWRGALARWDGAAWVTVGGHVWSGDPGRAIVRPALALLRGRVPIVAWAEQPSGSAGPPAAVRVARWNGPGTPPRPGPRASISGCAFPGGATTLSATGCFAIAGGRAAPHPGLVPFDLTSELWSDGALKRRWIALPDGQVLTAPEAGAWSAPPGTMIVKEFAYETTPGDPRTRRAMETRFLVRAGQTGWQGFSFRWRSDGADADLLPDDASTFAWPLDGGGSHIHSYPSRAQCARCHNPSVGPLLGLRTAQLARRVDHDGVIVDQLQALAQLGAIPAAPRSLAPFASPHDASRSLEARVRGYLAANCSHCHNPAGERPTRDFRWDTPLAQTMLCGPDSEVVAGDPASSVIVQRITTRAGGMPPIATLTTDPLAIDIVTRWIAGETNCP